MPEVTAVPADAGSLYCYWIGGDVLHAGVKRDPTKFSNSRNAGPHSTFLAAAPRSDA